MIEPTEEDVRRRRTVVYTGNRHPGGKLEYGVIVSYNEHSVFVRYENDTHSKATNRSDLEWLSEWRKR